MTDKTDQQFRKPDGSAYKAHLADIAERNVASHRAGRERRQAFEQGRATERLAAERRQDAGLRGSD